jgi:hypothetical protein
MKFDKMDHKIVTLMGSVKHGIMRKHTLPRRTSNQDCWEKPLKT